MAEILKTTHYNNGDEIPYTSNADWGSFDEGQYGVYDNDPANADIYGNLYNWSAATDERGVCPEGFHFPSDEEFMELEMFIGMSESGANNTGLRGSNEGSKLAGSEELWIDGDLENNSELEVVASALPGGYRSYNGIDNGMGFAAGF